MGGVRVWAGLEQGAGLQLEGGAFRSVGGAMHSGRGPPQVGVAFGLGAWLSRDGRGFPLTARCRCEVGVASLRWAWLWVGGATPERAWLLLGRRGSSTVGVA